MVILHIYVDVEHSFWLSLCILCSLFLGRSLSLWAITKKKPLCTVGKAHQVADKSKAGTPQESWITSVATIRNTDLIASGEFMSIKHVNTVCMLWRRNV